MRRFWPLLMIVLIVVLALIFRQDKSSAQSMNEPSVPTRIISIAPSITEMAFAIGLGDNIVGVSDYCDYPAEVETLPKVGGFINPNIEAIVSLKPDLVMLHSSNTKLISKLDQLGIKSLATDSSNLATIKASILSMGDYTKRHQQAQNVIDKMERQIALIHDKIKGLPAPSVLLVMGHSKNSGKKSTIFVAGQTDFYNDLITLAGGKNAFKNKSLKIGTLSTEGILTLNPDIIIDVFPEPDDHNYDIEKVKQQWQSLSQVNAVKNDRVYIIEEDYATIPGPRLYLLLAQIAKLFHPELNWQPS